MKCNFFDVIRSILYPDEYDYDEQAETETIKADTENKMPPCAPSTSTDPHHICPFCNSAKVYALSTVGLVHAGSNTRTNEPKAVGELINNNNNNNVMNKTTPLSNSNIRYINKMQTRRSIRRAAPVPTEDVQGSLMPDSRILLANDDRVEATLEKITPNGLINYPAQSVIQQGKKFDTMTAAFFDYEYNIMRVPEEGVQLHKLAPDWSGNDSIAQWHPRNAQRHTRHLAAPAARVGQCGKATVQCRQKRSTSVPCQRSVVWDRKGRAWGERHGEPRSDASSKEHRLGISLLLEETGEGMFQPINGTRTIPSSTVTTSRRTSTPTVKPGHELSKNAIFPNLGFGVEVLLLLTLAPTSNFFTVTMKTVKNLPYSNKPFAKVSYLVGGSKLDERQTSVSLTHSPPKTVRNEDTRNITNFSEAFLFNVLPSHLSSVHIIIQFYDHVSMEAINVGHIMLGQSVTGLGSVQWNRMMHRPGLPTAQWHSLLS